jgi:uncharacterized membrane protein
VGPTDRFCERCGAPQAGARATAASSAKADPLASISPRTANMLCYVPVVGWIACVVILASARFAQERVTRFHAFQGIYLFVVWLLVDWVLEPFFGLMPGSGRTFMRLMAGLMQLAVFVAWIFMLLKTSQEQMYRLPFIGELAERSLEEQQGSGPA